ncbi:unnamed protein product [Ectocarpus sp. CCAP 1310/34]|nr:unnamed protein product [Ectocarpus sp. CCAP 1310/34]
MAESTSSSSTESLRAILTGAEAVIFDLICAGASIEQWTEWLQTPFQHAVAAGKIDLIVQLAQAGAGGISVHSAVRRGEPDESGDTPLHIAASLGHHSILTLLLLQEAEVNALDGEDSAPLHVEAEQGSLAAVEALVSAHANLSLRFGDDDLSAMDRAAYFGHVDVMRVLIQHGIDQSDAGATGADVGAEDCGGDTPLHLAVRSASVDTMAALLRHGADANRVNGDQLSALHLAAKSSAVAMVYSLLAASAHPNLRAGEDEKTDLTALHLAISNEDTVVINALVGAGAEVDAQGGATCETPLHLATKLEPLNAVVILLAHKADPNKMNGNQYSALHLAAESGSTAIVHVLLADGVQPNLRGGEDGKAELDLATVGGHAETVAALVQHQASLKATDKHGRTDMHAAASYNNAGIIEVLSADGANVDARAQKSWTPVHVASSQGCAEALTALMRHGGGGNHYNTEKESPLHLAVCEGHCAAVTALLVGGANPNLCMDADSPLYLAACCSRLDVVKVLIQYGADVKGICSNRATALHTIVKNVDVVEALIDAGAHLEAEDDEGCTPLHRALARGCYEIVLALLKYDADPTKLAFNGRGGLHAAAEGGNVSRVELFLADGVDINFRVNAGSTALRVAARRSSEVVEKLLQHGADTDARNVSDRTPLHEATLTYKKEHNSVDALVDGGAAIDAWDNMGNTSLHIASLKHRCAEMKAFLRSGADVLARDNDGCTPLRSEFDKDPKVTADMIKTVGKVVASGEKMLN